MGSWRERFEQDTPIMRTLIILCISLIGAKANPSADIYRPLQVRNTNAVSGFNEENLGFLEPQPIPADEEFTAIMLDLLPEFTDVLKQFGGAQGGRLSITDMVSSFFPIVHKALEAKAKNEGRTLTNEEE